MKQLFMIMFVLFALSTIFLQAQDITNDYEVISPDNADQLQEIAVLQYDLDGNRKAINELEFHPTLPLLFSEEAKETVRIWNLETVEFVEALPFPVDYSTAFAISPNGENIVYGGWNLLARPQPNFASVNIWNMKDRQDTLLLREGQYNFSYIVYSDDGMMFAAAGWSVDTIRVWKVDDTTPLVFTGHGWTIYKIAFTHDNRLITTGEDSEVHIWNIETQELERVIVGFGFLLDPKNSFVIVMSRDPQSTAFKEIYTLYDLSDPDFTKPLEFDGLPLEFNPAGDIVVINVSGDIWLVNYETSKMLIRIDAAFATPAIAFSPDGRFIATVRSLDAISIWGIPTN